MLKKIWFDREPRTAFATKYIQSTANIDVAWMIKHPFRTLTVNLQQVEECILLQCTPNCRNEIRKGSKIGLNFHAGPTTQADANFIHHFLSTKMLGRFSRDYLADPQALVCITSLDGTRLATHLYVASSQAGRARLVYSAVADPTSIASPDGMSPQRLIGIANRFLHFSAILHFRAQGLSVYDFGGIGLEENDPKIKGINEFKRSFGGTEVIEYNYIPIWISMVEKILQRRAARRYRHR
jgi:hypothetical protein